MYNFGVVVDDGMMGGAHSLRGLSIGVVKRVVRKSREKLQSRMLRLTCKARLLCWLRLGWLDQVYVQGLRSVDFKSVLA